MANHKYVRNYLTNVIVRADFAAPWLRAPTPYPESVTTAILQEFPVEEQRTIQFGVAPVMPSGQEPVVSDPVLEAGYYSLDRSRHVGLARGHVFLEETRYEGFVKMSERLFKILEPIFACAPGLAIKRLGLRYMNVVTLPGRNVLNWSSYLDRSLVSSLSFPGDGEGLTRAMSNMELVVDGIGLRFQYGVWNPDYPNIVRRKEFILDLDASAMGLASYSEACDQTVHLHNIVESTFERSIKDALRKTMEDE